MRSRYPYRGDEETVALREPPPPLEPGPADVPPEPPPPAGGSQRLAGSRISIYIGRFSRSG